MPRFKKEKENFRRSRHVDRSVSVKVKDEADLLDIIHKKPNNLLFLILDSIQDPHNLGACLRTADGAGVDAVIVPKDRAVSLTPTVIEIASGGADNIPFIQVTNLARTIDELKEKGVWIVGTSDQADKSIYELDLTGSVGLVLGAEGKGVRRLIMEKCDFLAQIPMLGKVGCLNVSVACGVSLYEIVRQKISKNKGK